MIPCLTSSEGGCPRIQKKCVNVMYRWSPTQGELEEGGRQYNRQYIYTTNHLRSPISLEQSGFYDPSIPPTRFRLIFVENHLNNNTIDHPQAQAQTL